MSESIHVSYAINAMGQVKFGDVQIAMDTGITIDSIGSVKNHIAQQNKVMIEAVSIMGWQYFESPLGYQSAADCAPHIDLDDETQYKKIAPDLPESETEAN